MEHIERERRRQVKAWLWRHSTLKSVHRCGRYPIPGQDGVTIKVQAGSDGSMRTISEGLTWCSSVWACPDCSRNIATRRARYLSQVAKAWHDQGGQIAMITLTMRHDKSMALTDIIEAATKKIPTQGLDRAYGQKLPYVNSKTFPNAKAAEITYGKNGWHWHLHYLLFLDSSYNATDLDDIRHRMWSKWTQGLAQCGIDADEKQSDARFIMRDEGIGNYLIKAGLEIAAGTTKHGRKENVTPFQMLGYMLDHDTTCPRKRHTATCDPTRAEFYEKWREYETATKGRRQLLMPTRLGDWLGIKRDNLDLRIEAENQPDIDTQVTYSTSYVIFWLGL